MSITAPNLIASGDTLFLGGNAIQSYLPGIFGFNVIQAAAPGGVSCVVQISSPWLDITSSLIGFDMNPMDDDLLARCPRENSSGSSLIWSGRGGLPLGGSDLLSSGQISGIGLVTSPTVSLHFWRASLRTAAYHLAW